MARALTEPSSRHLRYQLAGAHGLPIEGVWYTSTYRDALIGMIDATGNVWRHKEESARVSIKRSSARNPWGVPSLILLGSFKRDAVHRQPLK